MIRNTLSKELEYNGDADGSQDDRNHSQISIKGVLDEIESSFGVVQSC